MVLFCDVPIYDVAGNQTRAMAPDGGWLRYEYDAANRLRLIRTDASSPVEHVGYGSTNARMIIMAKVVFGIVQRGEKKEPVEAVEEVWEVGADDVERKSDMPKEYVPNLNGGRKGSSYPDLTFEGPDGSKIRFNTYDSNMNGLPTPREADAAERLFRNAKGAPVVLIPKRKCVPCKE